MRKILATTAILLSAVALTGCAHSTVSTTQPDTKYRTSAQSVAKAAGDALHTKGDFATAVNCGSATIPLADNATVDCYLISFSTHTQSKVTATIHLKDKNAKKFTVTLGTPQPPRTIPTGSASPVPKASSAPLSGIPTLAPSASAPANEIHATPSR